jgi:hypothetical protein
VCALSVSFTSPQVNRSSTDDSIQSLFLEQSAESFWQNIQLNANSGGVKFRGLHCEKIIGAALMVAQKGVSASASKPAQLQLQGIEQII